MSADAAFQQPRLPIDGFAAEPGATPALAPTDDQIAGAWAVLASLPDIGSVRLRLFLEHHEPLDALERLASGRALHPMIERSLGRDLAGVRNAARQLRPAAAAARECAERCRDAGVQIVVAGMSGYPHQLRHDIDPPPVLFVRGDLGVLHRRRVGVVGTRNASAGGVATARELGEQLGAAGVAVVSGLAKGIDAAAHSGCRSVGGAPVAVVGSGPDVVYPRRHEALWSWVCEQGLLISEYPPRTRPDAWRFPRRNRILAALCEVLIVVESRERGGSLITAREALDRDVTVMAVPGSPRFPASVGTNRLLVDGAAPLLCADDVLIALDLDHRRAGSTDFDPRPRPTPDQERVLDACSGGIALTIDGIVDATGLTLSDAALAAARLERSGHLVEAGGWFEPAGSRLEPR